MLLENATAGANSLQSIPISEFVSALIGGGLALGGTIYSLKYQQKQRNKRLRRALISEINSIEAGQVHLSAVMFRTDGGGSDFLDDFVENQFNEVTQGFHIEFDEDIREEIIDTDEIKKESMRRAGRMVTSVNLSTPIWNSNTDKVGNLETDNIEKIIRFYRLLETCKYHIEKAVDGVDSETSSDENEDYSVSTESFNYHMMTLEDNAQALAERKKEALEALDAGEFIDIEDSYLIHTEGDEDDDKE